MPQDPAHDDALFGSGAPPGAVRPILIVDDEPPIVALLQDILEEAGYPVLTAPNGRVALELARRNELGLVLTDLMMPQMDGTTLCQRLRADPRTAHLPILVMTAARQPAINCDVSGLIAKPFLIEDVLSQVERFYQAY
ncbi:MAG TPA: response regulator [Roseiflexaceae bacterium]|nr:response regulator [Roseiflexaceae bacterium]